MTSELPPLTPMICAYPECSNMIWITVQQKREFKTYNVLKYGDSLDPYCSIECQQKHLKELAESEFLDKKNIKNREYALSIHGADEYLLKRSKEQNVHLVTGNTREQRARSLREYLISIHGKRKLMLSNEVQEFLFLKTPNSIKTMTRKDRVAAWRVMKKCKEMFPHEISIGFINGKDKYIELIN